ncbi:MAG TPA: thiolase family protein, partial [Chloroflexia bacterium]|nr:thiolase family protein [Chloroflexia bacterium]
MAEAVILEAVRTPYGKNRGGAYQATHPAALLAGALNGLLARAGQDPARIDDVVAGTVTQIGEQAADIARQAVLLAGWPVSVPAVTINRFCGSSQEAVHMAARAIEAGDQRYAIGAGVESMSRVPMFSDIGGSLRGLCPGLRPQYDLVEQGESAERVAAQWQISRAAADALAAESHRRAHAAAAAGRNAELLPTPGQDAQGRPLTLAQDEAVRAVIDPAKMASLAPVFRPGGDGVVTAGNASAIVDGAAAVLLADRAVAEADGFRPRARFRARVVVGSDPVLQLSGVIPATQQALARAGLRLADLDWIEINEAFAVVVLAWAREFDPDLRRVNPWGGAIAHGHPLGASGAGLLAKMLA